MSEDKKCPNCELICGPTEKRCDCGHRFELSDAQQALAREKEARGCLVPFLVVLGPVLGPLVWLLGVLGARRRTAAAERREERVGTGEES